MLPAAEKPSISQTMKPASGQKSAKLIVRAKENQLVHESPGAKSSLRNLDTGIDHRDSAGMLAKISKDANNDHRESVNASRPP